MTPYSALHVLYSSANGLVSMIFRLCMGRFLKISYQYDPVTKIFKIVATVNIHRVVIFVKCLLTFCGFISLVFFSSVHIIWKLTVTVYHGIYFFQYKWKRESNHLNSWVNVRTHSEMRKFRFPRYWLFIKTCWQKPLTQLLSQTTIGVMVASGESNQFTIVWIWRHNKVPLKAVRERNTRGICTWSASGNNHLSSFTSPQLPDNRSKK